MKYSALALALMMGVLSGCSTMSSGAGFLSTYSITKGKLQGTDYYRVTGTDQFRDPKWKTGAVIGGAVGVAASAATGSSSTLAPAVVGAAIGSTVQLIMTRNHVLSEVYVVDAIGDFHKVENDQKKRSMLVSKYGVKDAVNHEEYLYPGQCLEISRYSRGKPVVRKAHSSWCKMAECTAIAEKAGDDEHLNRCEW